MIVLSVEGRDFVDRCMDSTHKVLAVFATREETKARLPEFIPEDADLMSNVYLLTDLETGEARRVEWDEDSDRGEDTTGEGE
jgi:hypothetical protein